MFSTKIKHDDFSTVRIHFWCQIKAFKRNKHIQTCLFDIDKYYGLPFSFKWTEWTLYFHAKQDEWRRWWRWWFWNKTTTYFAYLRLNISVQYRIRVYSFVCTFVQIEIPGMKTINKWQWNEMHRCMPFCLLWCIKS